MSNEENPWTMQSTRTVYDNPWIRVDEHKVLDAGGTPRAYGIVSFKKIAVGVLPIFDNGDVALVGQFRLPLNAYSWEMPEGGSEPGEALDITARRELKEESGLSAEDLEQILVMHLSNSVSDEKAVIFLATGLKEGAPNPDEDEVLSARRTHFSIVLEEVISGRITDSLSVAAVLRAHHMATTGKLNMELTKAMQAPTG